MAKLQSVQCNFIGIRPNKYQGRNKMKKRLSIRKSKHIIKQVNQMHKVAKKKEIKKIVIMLIRKL